MIVAAAMGGLVCSLLLVIAVGCTCRLYALRVGLGRQHSYQGGRRSTQLAPLSRLEQHLLQREPPPSYSVAINDPSTSLVIYTFISILQLTVCMDLVVRTE